MLLDKVGATPTLPTRNKQEEHMTSILIILIGLLVTANAIWNNPDPCSYKDNERIQEECTLRVRDHRYEWVKKEEHGRNKETHMD